MGVGDVVVSTLAVTILYITLRSLLLRLFSGPEIRVGMFSGYFVNFEERSTPG